MQHGQRLRSRPRKPWLAFEATKALELKEMGKVGSEDLKELSSMEKQVREKLLCNFECAVDGSKPPTAPSRAA